MNRKTLKSAAKLNRALLLGAGFCLVVSLVPTQLSAVSLSVSLDPARVVDEILGLNPPQTAPSPPPASQPAAASPGSPAAANSAPAVSGQPAAAAKKSAPPANPQTTASNPNAPLARDSSSTAKTASAKTTGSNQTQASLTAPSKTGSDKNDFYNKAPPNNDDNYVKIGMSVALFGILSIAVFGTKFLLGNILNNKSGGLNA